MNMMYRVFVIMGIVSGVLFAAHDCYCAKFVKEKITAHLRNNLGADVQIEVATVLHGSTTAELLCPESYFLVKMSNVCYVAIPPSAFKEARFENLAHNITLSNGQKLRGTLTGDVLESTATSSDSRQYALDSATFLAIEFTAGTPVQIPIKTQDRWKLTYSNSNVSSYVLQNPQFGLVYEVGTPVKGRHNRITWEDVHSEHRLTRNFTVNVGGTDVPAAISDFSEIVLRPITPKAGTPASVLAKRGENNDVVTPPKPGSLEAARGPMMTAAEKAAAADGGRNGLASLGSRTEFTSSGDNLAEPAASSGNLTTFAASDSNSNPAAAKITMMSEDGIRTLGDLYLMNTDYDLALVAEIEGTGGAVLILLSPQCTIKKIAPPKNATAAANPVPANAVKSEMP